jgi:NAD(P)-dependent dehydrogenase (short-subunit alcohol dehydrogenase family)
MLGSEKMMSRFHEKTVVITGGSSGIGLAAARQFAAEGARLVVTGRNDAALQAAADSIGKKALGIKADVTNPSDLDKLFSTIKEQVGRIDVLFVNAGVAKVASVADTTEALFDEISDTNFKGAYFTAQKSLLLLNDGGAVIFTSSYFDEFGMAGTSVVSATKAAVRSLTRTLASELLPRRIRVNAISPGVINTPIFEKLGVSKQVVEEIGKALQQKIPFKRFGSPEEIAKAVAFLASSDASYITGVELAVDGGLTQL